MILEIQGRQVEVGPEFEQLSDEDKQKTVNEIAANLAAEEKTKQENALKTAAIGVGVPAAAYGAYKLSPTRLILQHGLPMINEAIGKFNVPQPAPGPVAQPAPGPVAPQTMPTPAPQPTPQAAQPGLIDKTTQMVRELAASKVMQGVAKTGAGIAAAVTPSNVGQNYPFPTSGPLRGSEINPATGRPWTQQELAAYRAQYGQ